jgi:hypothetical protein
MIAAVVFADDTPVLRLFAAALAMSAAATQLASLSVSPATTEFDIEPAIRMIERATAALVAARPLGIRADSAVEAEVETRVELEMIVADFEHMDLVIALSSEYTPALAGILLASGQESVAGAEVGQTRQDCGWEPNFPVRHVCRAMMYARRRLAPRI